MLGKIIFSVLALVLFVYIFLFKLIKKNDTTYFIIIGLQAIGIVINFIQIIFKIEYYSILKGAMYLLSIMIPIIVILLELKGWSFTETIYILTARIFLFIGRTKKAKEIIIKLLNKNYEVYKAHLILAKIYEESGGVRRAIDEYVKCIDMNRNDYNSYFRIAELLNESDKKEQAIEMLKNLLNKKQDFYKARELLGDILLEKQRFKEAIDNYIYALKYDENNWQIYYNLGMAYSRTNDFKNAKDYFEKATEINGDLHQAYYKLGQIALLYRDIEGAEIYFGKSLCDENESRASYELAKIYILKNDKTKAAIFLNKAIEVDPEYYKKSKEEPIFLDIKDSIKKPKENATKYIDNRTEKEKDIEKYLFQTYILTKEIEKEDKKFKLE